MITTNTHGGARRGAGRKPLDPQQATERVVISLPADLAAAMREIGAGNASEGARMALLHWLADNTPPATERQIWRWHEAHYLVLWQGAMVAAAGPMPLEQAQAMQSGASPLPDQWQPEVADALDAAWERGETERADHDAR